MQRIPDRSVDLAIVDPPYFKVANEEWDFRWRTISDYQKWALKWCAMVASKLRVGGTMYLFGYLRSLVAIIPYIDIYGLTVRQHIIIDKGMRAVSGRATRKYKMFPNTTESLLLITKDNRLWFKDYVYDHQFILKTLGVTSRKINKALGVKTNGGGMWSIYAGNNVCSQFPTREHYDIIREKFLLDLPEYDRVAQTFHPQMGLTNVWNDINFYYKGRCHPTEKPMKLVERLILASSNVGDVVLDPMFGSGNTLLSCIRLNRHYIGFELNKEYFDIAEQRIKDEQT